MKEYGPTQVWCGFTGDYVEAHRPGPEGPFFCMNCGATDHPGMESF